MKIERIHSLRIQHHLTQTEIAHALHISQRSYSHYETGTREIPLEILISLCDYYHVSADYILERSDNPNIP